jgi:hypothetical protein
MDVEHDVSHRCSVEREGDTVTRPDGGRHIGGVVAQPSDGHLTVHGRTVARGVCARTSVLNMRATDAKGPPITEPLAAGLRDR